MPQAETLTARERVIRTLNHQAVDRLPIDLGSHPSTGISAFAYWMADDMGMQQGPMLRPSVMEQCVMPFTE
jgi:hypothetical protein